MASETGSPEALRYPIHMTLRTGIVCPDGEAEELSGRFLAHAAGHPAVDAAADAILGIGYAGADGSEKGLVGYGVRLDEGLLSLHRRLLAFTEGMKGPQGGYHPHVSLCYGDIGRASAEGLAARHREAMTNAMPAWTIGTVELWRESGAGWKPFASAGLS